MVVLTILLQALLSVAVKAHEVAKCTTEKGELKYSYDPKKTNGVQWDCETCGTGIQQSPIDIPVDDVAPLPIDLKTEFDYPTKIQGTIKVNKGLVVQWEPTDDKQTNGEMTKTSVKFAEDQIQQVLDVAENFSCSNKYKLLERQEVQPLQFHLHTPSEHTLYGEQYPMELHIVNIAPDAPQCYWNKQGSIENCVAVVGIMYTVEDMENAEDDTEFTRIIEAATDIAKEEGHSLEVNLQKLLPDNKSYYTYKGSLTSPPCTETLLWHVMSTPMKVSQKVVDAVQDAVTTVNPDSKYDTRLTLPLHDRKVFWYNDANAENTVCPPETFTNEAEFTAEQELEVGQVAEEESAAEVADNGSTQLYTIATIMVTISMLIFTLV